MTESNQRNSSVYYSINFRYYATFIKLSQKGSNFNPAVVFHSNNAYSIPVIRFRFVSDVNHALFYQKIVNSPIFYNFASCVILYEYMHGRSEKKNTINRFFFHKKNLFLVFLHFLSFRDISTRLTQVGCFIAYGDYFRECLSNL